jgi:hypothetical protein
MRARNKPKAAPPEKGYVGGVGTLLFVALTIALSALALYGVWVFWPSENPDPDSTGLVARKTVHFFGWDRLLSRESLFFVMVAFAGALGGMVHSVRSLAVYVGSGKLKWSWTPFYLLKPVLGAVLATLLYFVLRAGLFSPSASTEQASPYGFAAIAALAGLFSDQAVEKLRVIAEELFQRPEVQKDHYTDDPPEVATGIAAPASTEATAAGTVNAKGQETTYYFEYGETTAYDNATPEQIAGAGIDAVEVSAMLTDLQPATTYHFRIVATNKAGTTQGDDRIFTTQA